MEEGKKGVGVKFFSHSTILFTASHVTNYVWPRDNNFWLHEGLDFLLGEHAWYDILWRIYRL
jgi:hypothetical protein